MNKSLLLSIIFIVILISITALLLSRYEVDDDIKFSSRNVNIEK